MSFVQFISMTNDEPTVSKDSFLKRAKDEEGAKYESRAAPFLWPSPFVVLFLRGVIFFLNISRRKRIYLSRPIPSSFLLCSYEVMKEKVMRVFLLGFCGFAKEKTDSGGNTWLASFE
ncbi:hypothetical protein TNIN_331 [Trichonephila inaurata madagascariensis]|uniref:Uncharacterized protein n=1 Tax=Trichonephila inaurata madagascariensis TaxID=2747483 RepID=A0A8X6X1W4_9ARAC|nr:hypothetical protein TNIN_331 [Trichonephila inaurata madagascariensis]